MQRHPARKAAMPLFHRRHLVGPTSVILFGIAILSIAQLATAETPALVKPAETQPLTRIGERATGFAVTCFAVATQGDLVALGGIDGNIRLWSLSANKVVRTIAVTKKEFIGSVAFSPDGKRMAFHADDELACLWDIEAGRELGRCVQEASFVDHIFFAPSGGLVGVVSDSLGFVWDTNSGKTWKSEQPVSSLAFSPDGKYLALGFNNVRLVEASSGRSIREFGKMEGQITSLAFSPDGAQLLAVDASCRGTMARLIAIASGEDTIIGEKIPSDRAGAAYAPNGKTIVVSDGTANLAFWDMATAKYIRTVKGIDHSASKLIFTPDGNRLLTGRNSELGDVLVWDTATSILPHTTLPE
jgi:WD40 repeat protein